MSPYGQEYTSTGLYNIYPMAPELLYTSPLIDLYRDVYNRSNNFNLNAYAELKPGFVKGLKYRLNAVYGFTPARTSDYTGRLSNNLNGSANISNSETKAWTIENILTYTKDWKSHHLDLTGLYSAQKSDYFTSNVNASGFINDLLTYNQIGTGTSLSGNTINSGGVDYRGSYSNRTTTLSQMARINYSYNSRYLFTITSRRDGYSAFGSNTDKYGIFSSAALAWNIGNENFIKRIQHINNLKLRVSYGQAGDPAVSPNQTTTSDATNRWTFNGVGSTGAVASVLGNPNLHWATTTGLNAGIDFSILKNRINGVIDYYDTKTSDILLNRNLPQITGIVPTDFNNPAGANSILTNLGKTANRGIEITLNTVNVQTTNFRWESSINYSANRNKITNLYGNYDSTGKEISDVGNRWFIGQPVRVIYDYQLEGVWQAGEAHAIDPAAKPGDLKFADVSGPKGIPDGVITADDRIVLGTPLPKWIGGFTNTFHYKNFHLNVFIQTFQGGLRNNAVLDNADQSGKINTPAEIGYWTAANQHTTRPALSYFNSRGYGYPSDNSYTRLKDVTLSYIFSSAVAERLHIGGLTLYASGRNLYTWTNWIGWDPEYDYSRQTSTNSNNYPLVRSIVFGLNVTLK
jgi:TonB-linked SusC/RagA family outer membrane protein